MDIKWVAQAVSLNHTDGNKNINNSGPYGLSPSLRGVIVPHRVSYVYCVSTLLTLSLSPPGVLKQTGDVGVALT